MATKVVIEGSRITPSDKLAPGERRAALLTKNVQALIDGGFVIVVSREELPDEAAPVEDDAPESDPEIAPEADTADGPPETDPETDDEPAEPARRTSSRRSKSTDTSE